MIQNKKSLYDFTFTALSEHLDSTYYARIVFEHVYQKKISCLYEKNIFGIRTT